MPATQRKRKQFKFWLNIVNPQEKYLTDVVAWLTEQGEFVRSIRDGLRLIYDLRFQKNTQSLVELFPDIREQLRVQTAPAISGGGQDDLLEIKAMLEMIARQQKATTEYNMQSPAPSTTTGKQLAAPSFAMPIFDDDEPTVLISASTNTDSSMNFVAALKNMQ